VHSTPSSRRGAIVVEGVEVVVGATVVAEAAVVVGATVVAEAAVVSAWVVVVGAVAVAVMAGAALFDPPPQADAISRTVRNNPTRLTSLILSLPPLRGAGATLEPPQV
jgi:hypothetical protein